MSQNKRKIKSYLWSSKIERMRHFRNWIYLFLLRRDGEVVGALILIFCGPFRRCWRSLPSKCTVLGNRRYWWSNSVLSQTGSLPWWPRTGNLCSYWMRREKIPVVSQARFISKAINTPAPFPYTVIQPLALCQRGGGRNRKATLCSALPRMRWNWQMGSMKQKRWEASEIKICRIK